ncbi:MAG: hypothetical protein DUW69_001614 [Verrucomicrobia bacterium]|nr:MAG: hypothetical protein DUW69_001614 [Verrucomicrobiota bacterium]
MSVSIWISSLGNFHNGIKLRLEVGVLPQGFLVAERLQ